MTDQYSMVRNMAIDSHMLMKGNPKTIDVRMAQVQRLQYQVGEIVCGIIIKEYLTR